jgi:hypothetical protein
MVSGHLSKLKNASACVFVDQLIPDVRDEASWSAVWQWFVEKLAVVCSDVAAKLRAEIEKDDVLN